MAIDTLKRIGESVCTDFLGFAPTSNGTKPPHIANGLFRACLGEVCNTKDVHEWLIGEGEKNAVSSEKLLHLIIRFLKEDRWRRYPISRIYVFC